MKKTLAIASMAVVLAVLAVPAEEKKKEGARQPLVQIALLLDTSNSMDGLINQAKSQLWSVVNEFALAKQKGQSPKLNVALYEYGNDRLNDETVWIREVCPLTDDLDKISEELFALRTNGGTECCGTVIKRAVDNLGWSKDADDLKMIFIAGNEPFTQGKINYSDSCKEAVAKGITVNTIFCGNIAEGIDTKWKDGAMLADGSFMNIDQNAVVADIPAPQDKEISELSTRLNDTYVAYGRDGQKRKELQEAQDGNAAAMGKVSFAQRSASKSGSNYVNSSWDLVDAVREEKLKIEDVKDQDLPENLRKMPMEERKKYVGEQAKSRQDIQDKIKKLNAEREKFVAEKRKESAETSTLDNAIIESVHSQARKKNFEFSR